MRGLLLLSIFFLAPAGCGRTAGHRPPRAAENLDYPVGAFALIERNGAAVTDQTLRGKVWVASFVFTRCAGPCKEVTATVARLQKELAGEPDVRFVTFTVDPSRDDPATLRQYAAMANADADKWLFLTGDEAAIHGLLEKQFKQSVGEKNRPGDEFGGHSTRLSVVDKKGVVRAVFDGVRDPRSPDPEGDFADNLRRLEARVRELAREP